MVYRRTGRVPPRPQGFVRRSLDESGGQPQFLSGRRGIELSSRRRTAAILCPRTDGRTVARGRYSTSEPDHSPQRGMLMPTSTDANEPKLTPPPTKVLGLEREEHFVFTTGGKLGGNGPSDVDVCLYTLIKWAGLAAKGNPSALHFLLLFPYNYHQQHH